jgi:hypothetical protein
LIVKDALSGCVSDAGYGSAVSVGAANAIDAAKNAKRNVTTKTIL